MKSSKDVGSETRFSNIVSVLALLISLASLIFTLSESYNREKFSLIMSENRDTGQNVEIFVPVDGSTPYLTVPVTIFITNTSGISQPIHRIDVTVDGEWEISWDDVFETAGGKLSLPKNIEPKNSVGILVVVHISLEPKIARDILETYNLPFDTRVAQLGKLDEFRSKTSQVKYSEEQNLYVLSQKHVKIDFRFLSASLSGPSVVEYTLILP